MPPFTIDMNKCRQDGICVQECPVMVIDLDADTQIPCPSKNFEELCINCGHCVSVCPHGAFFLGGKDPQELDIIDKKIFPTAEQIISYMKARRSIRVFKDKPVPRTELEKLLDITCYAPTGHNQQPLEWLIIDDQQEVARLTDIVLTFFRWIIENKPQIAGPIHLAHVVKACESGHKRICRNAPHLIIAHSHKSALAADQAGAIALAHLEIAAPAMGLGTCWGGYYSMAAAGYAPFLNQLDLPEDHKVQGVLMTGYPKYDYHRIPMRKELKVVWTPA